MFEILVIILFIWLFWQALRLVFSVAWGLAKVLAVILCIVALPALVVGLVSAAGAFLLIPMGLIAGAWGILKGCA